jgi:hypothetical protein
MAAVVAFFIGSLAGGGRVEILTRYLCVLHQHYAYLRMDDSIACMQSHVLNQLDSCLDRLEFLFDDGIDSGHHIDAVWSVRSKPFPQPKTILEAIENAYHEAKTNPTKEQKDKIAELCASIKRDPFMNKMFGIKSVNYSQSAFIFKAWGEYVRVFWDGEQFVLFERFKKYYDTELYKRWDGEKYIFYTEYFASKEIGLMIKAIFMRVQPREYYRREYLHNDPTEYHNMPDKSLWMKSVQKAVADFKIFKKIHTNVSKYEMQIVE